MKKFFYLNRVPIIAIGILIVFSFTEIISVAAIITSKEMSLKMLFSLIAILPLVAGYIWRQELKNTIIELAKWLNSDYEKTLQEKTKNAQDYMAILENRREGLIAFQKELSLKEGELKKREENLKNCVAESNKLATLLKQKEEELNQKISAIEKRKAILTKTETKVKEQSQLLENIAAGKVELSSEALNKYKEAEILIPPDQGEAAIAQINTAKKVADAARPVLQQMLEIKEMAAAIKSGKTPQPIKPINGKKIPSLPEMPEENLILEDEKEVIPEAVLI